MGRSFFFFGSDMKKKTFKIKNFGKDEVFDSVQALEAVLSTKYKGMHVSIIYPSKLGLLSTVFVSVNNDGEVYESYGNEDKVDFSQM